MIPAIQGFVKKYKPDIILAVGVLLLSLLAFGIGYLVAKEQLKEPLRIEYGISS